MQKIYMKTLIFLLKSGKSALMISKGGQGGRRCKCVRNHDGDLFR